MEKNKPDKEVKEVKKQEPEKKPVKKPEEKSGSKFLKFL